MKVIHLSYADEGGGAFIATNRLHNALLSAGIISEMWVNKIVTDNPSTNVFCLDGTKRSLNSILRALVGRCVSKILKPSSAKLFSINMLPSSWVKKVNESDADIVHLHWIHSEMLSIKDISRITKPIIWTLHDMWAFCGGEHYPSNDKWIGGYCKPFQSFPEYFDANGILWRKKKRLWQQPFHIIAPSSWMLQSVEKSRLMHLWPVFQIHNAVDANYWKPLNQTEAQSFFNLDHRPTLIFGAMGGKDDPRKGYDLLENVLDYLNETQPDLLLNILVFGGQQKTDFQHKSHRYHFIGHTDSIELLRQAYSAADAMLIPSRQDNLPNTAVEALSCGVPCVAFDIGGMSDLVYEKEMGYLAQPYDIKDFAEGVLMLLKNKKMRRKKIAKLARNKFDSSLIAAEHITLYARIVQESGSK